MKSKIITILIIASLIILISVLINGIFLLKTSIQQNKEILGMLKDFNHNTATLEKFNY